MIRIGLDARLLAYRREGIARYILELASRLPQVIHDPDVRLVIFQSRKDPNTWAAGPQVRVAHAWTPPHHRWEQHVWPLEVSLRRVAMLHSPDFIPPFSGSFRKVITVHDLHFLKYPNFMTGESRRYYAGQIERAVAVADHIIAVSWTTRADLIAHLGVPEDRITVIYEGASAVCRPLPPEQVREALARLSLEPGYVLFVGTWEPRKNIPMLLRAYARLRERRPDAPPLVLAGRRGWLYQEILEWPHRLHIAIICAGSRGRTIKPWRSSTTGRPSWPSPRCMKASACRPWRPWPAAPRWWSATGGRCPRWWERRGWSCPPKMNRAGPKPWRRS